MKKKQVKFKKQRQVSRKSCKSPKSLGVKLTHQALIDAEKKEKKCTCVPCARHDDLFEAYLPTEALMSGVRLEIKVVWAWERQWYSGKLLDSFYSLCPVENGLAAACDFYKFYLEQASRIKKRIEHDKA